MKIKNIIKEEIDKYILSESEWNFHHTKDDIQGYGKPYASDTRSMMIGRSTGHFGSGTYFSTYNAMFDKRDDFNKYTNDDNPEFIKVDNGVYRVDFDIYKNLYKVENEKEGDVLYSTLRNLNSMFNSISLNKNYNNSNRFQIIKNNCKYLDLKCPSYMELTRMMQKYSKSDNVQSFSTYFMELNGFNGVNVSGIPKYDNTTHGSVIYDLSKKSLTPVNINKNVKGTVSYNGDTVAREDYFMDDEYTNSLVGNNDTSAYALSKLDKDKQKRIIKNYINSGRLFSQHEIEQFDEDIIKYYMNYLYNNQPSDMYSSFDENVDRLKIIKVAINHKLYYWVNYNPTDNVYKGYTGLIHFLNDAWNNDDYPSFDDEKEKEYNRKYLVMLLKYMKRPLIQDEKEYIRNNILN